MRKALGIFFLVIYSFSFSEFHQLMKIPAFIQHYTQHSKNDPSLSVLDFIKIHYKGIFEVDDDYQQDQQLPFRSSDCMVYSVSICEAPVLFFEVSPNPPVIQKQFFPHDESAEHLACLRDVFQPPRLA
ncbi:MAG: hypothetical protein K2P88_11585 [Chitinophagaceae bacterium]|nr:hypothetical protein [Chitinophagaceae bacterium]